MGRELVWNDDKTTKYDSADIARFDIKTPGSSSFISGTFVTLTQWQVAATPRSSGLIYCGLYSSKEEAVKEVDRLSALGMANGIRQALDVVEEESS